VLKTVNKTALKMAIKTTFYTRTINSRFFYQTFSYQNSKIIRHCGKLQSLTIAQLAILFSFVVVKNIAVVGF
jgi:hypothetical protein